MLSAVFFSSSLRLQCSLPSALPQSLEPNPVVTEMLLSLATSHSETAIHPSQNVILTLFWNLYSQQNTDNFT